MIDPTAPAYPRESMSDSSADRRGGLTIRAELAARAMQGIISNPNINGTEYLRSEVVKAIACAAVEMADALVKELNRSVK